MSKSPYLINPNILAHPDRIVHSVELDMEAQETYLAGSPISALGKLANDETAFGVLLYDVHKSIGGHVGTVVISGYIQQDVAAEWSGITISDAAKSAMINVLFTDDGSRAGGASSWADLEGKPFYEEVTEPLVITWDGDLANTDAIIGMNHRVSDILLGPDDVDGATFHVVLNGAESDIVAVKGANLIEHTGEGGDYWAVTSQGLAIAVFANAPQMLPDGNMLLPGVYFVKLDNYGGMNGHVMSLQTVNGVKLVHPLVPMFLPKAARVSYVTETPTADDFNALLTSLREAGYMA